MADIYLVKSVRGAGDVFACRERVHLRKWPFLFYSYSTALMCKLGEPQNQTAVCWGKGGWDNELIFLDATVHWVHWQCCHFVTATFRSIFKAFPKLNLKIDSISENKNLPATFWVELHFCGPRMDKILKILCPPWNKTQIAVLENFFLTSYVEHKCMLTYLFRDILFFAIFDEAAIFLPFLFLHPNTMHPPNANNALVKFYCHTGVTVLKTKLKLGHPFLWQFPNWH